jgi:cutinase
VLTRLKYPADISLTGATTGANDIIKRLTDQDQACPNQKFALVGYSQGAAVMHLAAGRIPAAIQSKVLALVMFGDGNVRLGSLGAFPGTMAQRTMENCNPGDPVCSPGSCFDPHLLYWKPEFMTPSIDFIVSAFKGMPKASYLNNGTVAGQASIQHRMG